MNEARTGWVLALIFLALLTTGLALYVRRREVVARLIGDRDLVQALTGIDLHERPWPRLALVLLAGIALAGALLSPPLESERPASRGPVVLILDASASMLAEDAGGSRIDAERVLARSLVDALPDRPIGIVAFAGRAFSLTPPTRDRGAIDMYLDALDPTIVTQTGSALGAALRQGLGLVGASGDPTGATIVLVGDGDETDDPDAALEAAELVGRAGVTIHAVGVGGEEGAPVPALDPATGEVGGTLRDEAGEPIVSRRTDDLLREIASEGGGTYLVATGNDAAVTSLAEQIRGGGEELSEPRSGGRLPAHVWMALIALALLVAEPAVARWEAK
jgi:Ca-activated chloride channel family protein